MLPDSPEIWMGVESWSDVLPEMEGLWKAHHQEIAQDQDGRMPLDPDYAGYAELERREVLHVVTIRVDQALVGYYVGFVGRHLHYQSTIVCHTDVYYLMPMFRRGWLGVRFFREVEASLRTRGVQKIFVQSKVYADRSALFRRLGWTPTESVWSKWIGEGA